MSPLWQQGTRHCLGAQWDCKQPWPCLQGFSCPTVQVLAELPYVIRLHSTDSSFVPGISASLHKLIDLSKNPAFIKILCVFA